MIEAILWDNDGVLVDTEEIYFQAIGDVLSTVGVTLTREQFIRISLERGASAFDLAAAKEISAEKILQLRAEKNRHYSRLLEKGVHILDGVVETLESLHGKVAMGVVTSCRGEHFRLIHRHTDLLCYFDFVLVREDYRNSKPDPEPYLTAVSKNRLDPQRCLIVEDTQRGLAAARAAGIRCAIVPNGLTRNGLFPGAFRVLENVREIIGLVLP